MRFLDTKTCQFVEMTDIRTVEYAILSHTWDPRGEQTFQDLKKIQDRYPRQTSSLCPSVAQPSENAPTDPILPPRSIWGDPNLSPKIRDACGVALANGFDLIWIDSCCIDKTSSAELSEAINSMYAWYTAAEVCYAYLVDVPPNDDHWASRSSFRQSVWFTRGWTLQELIAPFEVIVLSQDWSVIGSKRDLVDLIEEVTNISAEALLHEIPLNKYSVAQRLSWASRRRTTRIEDQAYSLLGIFDIHMPTLYGEGERAFRRLQEAIMQRIPDQTLFAWWMVFDLSEIHRPHLPATTNGHSQPPFVCSRHLQEDLSILARSPFDFVDVSSITAVSQNDVCRRLQLPQLPMPEYTFTPHGIRTQLPVIPLSLCLPPNAISCPDDHPVPEWYLAILGCESSRHRPGHLLGRLCNIPPSDSAGGIEFLYSGLLILPKCLRGVYHSNLFTLPPATLELHRRHIELKVVYIAHACSPQFQTLPGVAEHRPHKAIHLTLSRRSRSALLRRGYSAELREPDRRDGRLPNTHRLRLSHPNHTIIIEYEHALAAKGTHLTIGGHAIVSRPNDVDSELSVNYANPSTVVWTDMSPWRLSLQSYTVDISVSGRVCTLRLGMTFVRRSYYSLMVEVLDDAATTIVDTLPAGGRVIMLASLHS